MSSAFFFCRFSPKHFMKMNRGFGHEYTNTFLIYLGHLNCVFVSSGSGGKDRSTPPLCRRPPAVIECMFPHISDNTGGGDSSSGRGS